MATLKLYFATLSEDQPIQITVHRDLLTLREAWEQADKLTNVGLIHIGFLRPKIKNVSILLKHKGQVLVSVAAKWTLPEEYRSSIAVVAEMILPSQVVPLYQLVKGLGYDQDEPTAAFQSSSIESWEEKHTTAEAVLTVLNGSERPLNKREIFTRIVEQGLSQIVPLYQLAKGLGYDQDEPTVCSQPVPTPLFRKSRGDRYNSLELVSTIPLKEHFEKALLEMKDTDRQVMEYRTGYNGVAMTLEAVGECIGVTRERVRQIQKKCVYKIIKKEYWVDRIALKIGQLLIERTNPLYLELLEIEDLWFEGFMGNYQHLAVIIELFSKNEIRIVNINGASVVTRIKADIWEDCVSRFRKSLKDKADEGGWTRHDIAMTFNAGLSEKGATELLPLMWKEFDSVLRFDGEGDAATLLTFGTSAESVVQAVLLKAEEPLHFIEVAVRATELFGRTVDDRLAQNALVRQGAKLFGRGIYGLEKFNPISPRMCNRICLVVTNLIYDGPLMKQWHANEILTALQARFSDLPEELDNYILNIILGNSDKLVYLNRMVWGRADSSQSASDRVDMANAFTQILEENGAPLKGKEIKDRLAAIRGVSNNLQLQPTERMIQIGPDFWGLIERDIGGTQEGNQIKLDKIFDHLQTTQKGIHVSEVGSVVEVSDTSSELPSAYVLLNLAQRDKRFYLGRSMLLGLSVWSGDTRRLNISQAVRELLSTMTEPMSIGDINARIEDLTRLPVDGTVTRVLINEGSVYNSFAKLWFMPKT